MVVLAEVVKALKANPRFVPHQGRACVRESEDCLQWGFSRFEEKRTLGSECAPLDKRISSDSNWHNLDATDLMGEAYALQQKSEWYITSVPLLAASQPIDYLILRKKQMEIWFKQCMTAAARAYEGCNWDGARRYFSQALQYCPSSPAFPAPSPSSQSAAAAAAAYFGRAEALVRQHRYEEAAADYRACLRADCAFLGARERLAHTELQQLVPPTAAETDYGEYDDLSIGSQCFEGRKSDDVPPVQPTGKKARVGEQVGGGEVEKRREKKAKKDKSRKEKDKKKKSRKEKDKKKFD